MLLVDMTRRIDIDILILTTDEEKIEDSVFDVSVNLLLSTESISLLK